MFNISDSIKISKPVSEVYDFTAELCNLPRWQKSIEYVEAPDGPARMGEKYTEVRRFMGQELKTTYQIQEVVPQSRLSLEAEGPMKLHVDMDFHPEGSRTRVTTAIRGEADGMMNMDEKAIKKQFEKELKDDSKELRHILEMKM